jgi:hypothetical protein
LCSAAVAGFFWFTGVRARRGHARTANHRGRCSPDRISRPHMGRECVGPASVVRFGRPIKNIFTHLFIRTDVLEPREIWVGPLMPYPVSVPLVTLDTDHASPSNWRAPKLAQANSCARSAVPGPGHPTSSIAVARLVAQQISSFEVDLHVHLRVLGHARNVNTDS